MLHVGLDLSRNRVDVHIADKAGHCLEAGGWPSDEDGLSHLVDHVGATYPRQRVLAVVESMNGARFVHDTLERSGWRVEVAHAQRVKGLAPLTCKTDLLTELARAFTQPNACSPAQRSTLPARARRV